MPRQSSFYVVKDVEPPASAGIEVLAEFHQVPRLTNLDTWALARLAAKKARAGDWTVNLSVTTLIALLVAVRQVKETANG